MTSPQFCPGCGASLGGLGLYCWSCGHYVADLLDDEPDAREQRSELPDNRSEEEIQLAVRRALELLGYHVSDLSQGRPTRQTPGIPDLWVMGHGRGAWIEVKRPTGRTSADQEEWHRTARANGVECLVVRSEADVIAWHEKGEAAA